MGIEIGDRVEALNDEMFNCKKGEQGICTGVYASDSELYITVKLDSGLEPGMRLECNWKKVEG